MKTSKYLIFFFSIISFGIEAQNWELVWQDEFTGSILNEQKWVHEIGTGSQNGLWGWGNGESQYYTSRPENIFMPPTPSGSSIIFRSSYVWLPDSTLVVSWTIE